MPELDIATRVAQALGAHDPATGALVPPLYSATTYARGPDYRLPGAWSYGRPHNPTVEAAEAVVRAIEGGAAALLFSSGMAAATAVFQSLKPGDHVVAPKVMYWALRSYVVESLQPWGVAVDLVDMTDLRALAAEGPITLVHQDQPRLLNLGARIYLADEPAVRPAALDLTRPDAAAQLGALAAAGPTYLIADGQIAEAYRLRERLPRLRELRSYPYPSGTMAHYLYLVEP